VTKSVFLHRSLYWVRSTWKTHFR